MSRVPAAFIILTEQFWWDALITGNKGQPRQMVENGLLEHTNYLTSHIVRMTNSHKKHTNKTNKLVHTQTWWTNGKSHTCFQFIAKSMTFLDDVEQPIRTLEEKVFQHFTELTRKKLNKDIPILSAAKCRPMTKSHKKHTNKTNKLVHTQNNPNKT